VLQKSLVLSCRYSSLEERFEKRDCRREIAEEGVAEVACAVFLYPEIAQEKFHHEWSGEGLQHLRGAT